MFSCEEVKDDKEEVRPQLDTIQVIDIKNTIDHAYSCQKLLTSYYSKFGVIIQKYYELDDYLIIDLNRDGITDVLAVLAPIPLEDTNQFGCLIENALDRLVVEIINEGEYVKIRNVYSNLVSNIGGVLSKYNGIFLTKNGFEIRHQSGNRFSWIYITEYSTQSIDGLVLKRIKKICSVEGREKSYEYLFESSRIQHMLVNDTIQADCNCETAWNDLSVKK
ncbi:MAG: hypothetical protein COA57_00125 [Flavobacteriales bacterium]|nr:MAG: hypothetical protein COA57_00125 [Flavobacteriales bacterium]